MTIDLSTLPIGADSSAQDIVTARLELIAITPAMVRAELAGSSKFSELIHAEVPHEWPHEYWDTHALEYLLDKMARSPNCHGWGRYVAVKAREGARRVLAGSCGATLPIEWNDDVEIGYGFIPSFQGFGYATEAVAALVSWIFQHPHVRSIKAQTFPHLQSSLRVLAKNGFQPAGPGPEEGTVLFRKWRDGL